MAQVSVNSVNHALTAVVIQGLADREDFVGLRAAPPKGRQSLKGEYPVIQLAEGEMMRDNMERREPGSAFKRVSAEIGLDSTKLQGDGLDIVIPTEVYEEFNASVEAGNEDEGYDLLQVYGEEAFLNGLRLHERRVAALAQGAGFDSVNSTVAYTAGNLPDIRPSLDMQSAIRRIKARGEKADAIFIPAEVWDRIKFADDLRTFITGNDKGTFTITPEMLATAFAPQGIRKVEICEAYVNNAAKKKANIVPVWSNSHIFVGAADAEATGADSLSNSRRMRSAMKTFFWEKLFGAPFVVKTFYDEDVESHIVRVWGFTDEKIVNARAGTRIATQFA